MITLDEQIAEARREVALRRNVYPKRIRAQQMKQHEADRHMTAMVAILETLEKLKEEGRWK